MITQKTILGLVINLSLKASLIRPLKSIERAVALDTNVQLMIYYKLGDVYLKMEMLEEAVKEYRKAIALRPDYP